MRYSLEDHIKDELASEEQHKIEVKEVESTIETILNEDGEWFKELCIEHFGEDCVDFPDVLFELDEDFTKVVPYDEIGDEFYKEQLAFCHEVNDFFLSDKHDIVGAVYNCGLFSDSYKDNLKKEFRDYLISKL